MNDGGSAIVRARGLRKDYGRGEGTVRAVDGVDLAVERGEVLAVMGPSGCGKSTLLHLLGGLDRPDAGELWLEGRRVDGLSERALAQLRRHQLGFVFQAFHLMDELTAQENVELPALLAGRSARAARGRARQLLDQVGLADRAKHLPSALSGGQRQRVAIARALANEPLADAARSPRRGRWSIALSSRLPVPLLLGLRLASRRRRRAVLSAASIAITVGALVTVLMFREHAHSLATGSSLYRFSGPGDPLWQRGMDVKLVFTIALVAVALVNAVLVTWATVQDARHASAVERALGASPEQVTAGLVVAQLPSALPGAILGIPVGVGLYVAVGRHGSTVPPAPAPDAPGGRARRNSGGPAGTCAVHAGAR